MIADNWSDLRVLKHLRAAGVYFHVKNICTGILTNISIYIALYKLPFIICLVLFLNILIALNEFI